MSIVRVGLSEDKGFAEGFDLIFGKKDKEPEKEAPKASDEKKEAEKGEKPAEQSA